MKFVKLKVRRPIEEVVSFVSDNDRVNDKVRFDEKRGTPHMHVKVKNNSVRIRCEMMGRPTKDNGFLVGTYFAGRTKQVGDITKLRGVIVTEPHFHLIWLFLVGYFVWMCIAKAAFSIVPVCLIVFVYFMFRGEYKKQKRIKAYLARACKRASV